MVLAYTHESSWRNRVEYHDDSGHWFRAYGNEIGHFDANCLMAVRVANIAEHSIAEAERQFRRPVGRRSNDHSGLNHFGL